MHLNNKIFENPDRDCDDLLPEEKADIPIQDGDNTNGQTEKRLRRLLAELEWERDLLRGLIDNLR